MAHRESEEFHNEMREIANVQRLEDEADLILANPSFWMGFRPDRVVSLIVNFKALVCARDLCNRLDPDIQAWLRENPPGPDEGGGAH